VLNLGYVGKEGWLYGTPVQGVQAVLLWRKQPERWKQLGLLLLLLLLMVVKLLLLLLLLGVHKCRIGGQQTWISLNILPPATSLSWVEAAMITQHTHLQAKMKRKAAKNFCSKTFPGTLSITS
jgi:hypothetical protein